MIRFRFPLLLAAWLAAPALAQTALLDQAAPPPPPAAEAEPAVEPQVTIRKKDGETVAEYRINNRLYMIKVTRDNGATFYLIDETGDGNFVRRDAFDGGLKVPMWVIKSW